MNFRNALAVIDGCGANEQRRLSHEYGLGKLLFLSFPTGKMYAVGIISFMSLLVKHMHLKFGFYRTHNSVCTLYRLVCNRRNLDVYLHVAYCKSSIFRMQFI